MSERPKRGFNAIWTEKRIVRGVIYATSKTDAAKRIRNGEGLVTSPGHFECSAPIIGNERSLWGRST